MNFDQTILTLPKDIIINLSLFKKWNKLILLNFHANWNNSSQLLTNEIIPNLFNSTIKNDDQVNKLYLLNINIDDDLDLAQLFNIESIPTIIFIYSDQILEIIQGINPPALLLATNKYINMDLSNNLIKSNNTTTNDNKENLMERIEKLVKKSPIMIFIKGTPQQPRCKFSKTLINELLKFDINYSSFNILEDDDIRQGLKEYSNWPTFPQIYINGEI